MRELRDRVAVITGGASGIGLACAEKLAAAGAKLVLADIEEAALEAAAADLRAAGAEVIAVPTDVSDEASVEHLAVSAYGQFGAVHVVLNNAGVEITCPIWEASTEDWQWVLGVNLWGVVHGVHSFVPRMLEEGDEGHIVNTASMAGLLNGPRLGVYNVSKHGVVALSETLYLELQLENAPIGVSVLCPGFVRTRIAESGRNRPESLRNAVERPRDELGQQVVSGVAEGTDPALVGDQVVHAIRNDEFYILPHRDEFAPMLHQHTADIVDGRNPSFDVLAELAAEPTEP